ncbi:helix-turn-helix domain-containing protein [Massilia sp. S19_KUP03_FR1]|uniref:helix-turn-helix domain-containing protein n=1 Tax=Massilia sp. S19_KUP03_FR1 TaxID=3025503 RepID=UPI002FCCFE7E
MSIGQRIKESRRAQRLSQSELAQKVGLTQATLSDLENDKSKGTARIASIATALKVRPLWLETGRGAPTLDDSYDGARSEVTGAPLTQVVQASVSGWIEIMQENISAEFPGLGLPDQSYFLKIKGDGFGDRILSGDTLIINPNAKTLAGDIVYSELKDGRAGIFRLRFIRDSETCYDPLNRTADSLTLPSTEIIRESKIFAIIPR